MHQPMIFSSQNLKKFQDKIVQLNLNSVESEDVNSYYNGLLSLIKSTATECFTSPPRKKKRHIFKIPWLTPDLANACRLKNLLYKRFQHDRSNTFYEEYKRFRNNLTSELRKSRKSFIGQQLNQFRSDSRKVWQILNNLTARKQQHSDNGVAAITLPNGTVSTKEPEVADCLNNYFANIGSDIAKSLPNTDIRTYQQYLTNFIDSSFNITPVTEADILKTYKSLRSSNAIDIDGLTKRIFDSIFDLLLPHITKIVNLSFITGTFPAKMKVAKVTPIFKAGDRKCPANYRPISILPFFSKILEKTFNDKLLNFLIGKDIINPAQYGFIHGRSTVLAAVDLLETIGEALKNKQNTIAVSLDLTKAFDSLNHTILLDKLHHYGIRGLPLGWLTSYLASRSQITALCNGKIKSKPDLITHGVPQGSILGPTLFLIYINDLPLVSSVLKFILYADDTTLLYSYPSAVNPSATLQTELNKVSNWLYSNQLKLNTKKTQAIIFPNGPNTQNVTLKIENTTVDFTQTLNFLGITFDPHLTFKSHIDKTRKKVSSCIGALYRVKNLLPMQYKLQLEKLYCTAI